MHADGVVELLHFIVGLECEAIQLVDGIPVDGKRIGFSSNVAAHPVLMFAPRSKLRQVSYKTKIVGMKPVRAIFVNEYSRFVIKVKAIAPNVIAYVNDEYSLM